MELEITQDQFKSWVESPITQHVIKAVQAKREQLRDHIEAGNTLGLTGTSSTEFMVGQIHGLTELFNLFEDGVSEPKEERPDYGH